MTYTVPPRLAYVVVGDEGSSRESEEGPVVYLMRLPDGPPLRLTDSAAVIWLVASDGEADVVKAVAEAVGQSPADIQSHVREYLQRLVTDGLLTPSPQ